MAESAARTSRGLIRGAVVLLLAGAALMWLASGLTWLTASGVTSSIEIAGAACLPALRAVALLSLAAVGGLIAAPAAMKRVVGAVIALVGLASLAGLAAQWRDGFAGAVATLPSGLDGSADVLAVNLVGPSLAALGLVAVSVGGILALIRPGVGGGLGRRFDRTASPQSGTSPAEMWSALDRGEDPTGDPSRSGDAPS